MPHELIVPFKIKKYMHSSSVAELIVNAEMEQIFFNAKEAGIYGVDGKWYIRDYGKGLQLSHFVENENFENCHQNSSNFPIDMGLVNAIAYLIFTFVDVVIYSKFNTFTFKIAKFNNIDRSGMLRIIYSKPYDPDFIGTLFEFTNPNNKEMLYAQSEKYQYWEKAVVEKTPYGQIISKPTNKGAVFVNGIKIANISEPHFVFNITSVSKSLKNAILLNRFTVPKQLYEENLKKILLASKSVMIAERFVYQNYLIDKECFFKENDRDAILIHFIKIMNRYKNYYFISYADCMHKPRYAYYAEEMGDTVFIVKDSLIKYLYALKDYENNPIMMKNNLLRKYKSGSFVEVNYAQLEYKEINNYSYLKFIFKMLGGKPKEIDNIKIVETPERETGDMFLRKSFYNKNEKTLYLNRDALFSKKRFITVLIRELITIEFGFKPYSDLFVSKMIEIMGDITSQYINKRKV